MIKYLKWIVLVFGTIGVIAASFFYLQNRTDIGVALEYRGRIDYRYLHENCREKEKDYLFVCIKNEFEKYLEMVSLTGTSMGLKMVFNVMDQDQDTTTIFGNNNELKRLHFTINYIEINNLAMNNAYRRYFGFKSMYGGYIASLQQFYRKANAFNDNLIIGMEGPEGISKIVDPTKKQDLTTRLESSKAED